VTHSHPSQLGGLAAAYQVGRSSRRDFILRAAALLGGAAMAASYADALGLTRPRAARAQEAAPPPFASTQDGITVLESDPTISAGMVEYTSLELDAPMLSGYLARPAAPGIYPGVVIVHENRGLQEHNRDVARRYAREGFAALAVDLLAREGGTASIDRAEVGRLLREAGSARHASDAMSAGAYLRTLEGVHADTYGITGFCFGGGITWLTATQDPAISAAVPYYGGSPSLDAIPGMRAAVLGIYAETDTRLNAGLEQLRPALEAASIQHQLLIYPNANHGFFNDTSANNYAPEAAADAWVRTVNWFRTYLPAAMA
jgi:carboxymethylenebutenolidase